MHIVEDHAEFVRDPCFGAISRREAWCGSRQLLDAESVRLPIRIDGGGRSTGGGLFSRGHIYKILSNPIYVGRIAHKGQVHEGQHDPIVDQETWDQVQSLLADHAQNREGARQALRRPACWQAL